MSLPLLKLISYTFTLLSPHGNLNVVNLRQYIYRIIRPFSLAEMTDLRTCERYGIISIIIFCERIMFWIPRVSYNL